MRRFKLSCFKKKIRQTPYADDAAQSIKEIAKVRVLLEKVVMRQGTSLRVHVCIF